MILDNNNDNKKVHEWLSEFTEAGELDVVTGYFTVGALACLSREVNRKIRHFRFVLGDIVNIDLVEDRTIDLLNENISVEAALKLSSAAREAVEFLKQDKVEAKTLEPNFCHAKVYLFDPDEDDRHKYFITGSSNLTEAGIGLKETQNVELNIAETGDNNQYRELMQWFKALWSSKRAHTKKTIIEKDGSTTLKPFKEYLIECIEKIFIQYTPRELYYKVLFELFGSQLLSDNDNPDFSRQVGRLENTVIYNTLYDFQQKGTLSLIKMLQKYDGAILADAVGLGKTWSALAVMKFFQLQGREVILICPKKLQYNWHRYLKNQDSRFEKDQFEYFIRFHTDLLPERMDRYSDRADKLFVNDRPKLFVIDESHNLRNSKSKRYNFLVDQILKKNEDVKVLMLSATPINNTLIDIRNQFKLIKQGKTDGFRKTLDIRNIDHLFNRAQHAFSEWRNGDRAQIADFIRCLPRDFFRLTDSLTVARTRPMIEKQESGLYFPKKNKPENLFVTPRQIGNFDSFEELFSHFPPFLSAYQPSFYVEQDEDVDLLHDERQRDRFLVKMLYILLVKRLESSWYSFHSTVRKVLEHHDNTLQKISQYQKKHGDSDIDGNIEQGLFDDDELEGAADDFTLGKKRKVSLKEIEEAGKLDIFKKDLKKDIDALDLLNRNLRRFHDKIESETLQPGNHASRDDKLQALMSRINRKKSSQANSGNQKVVLFTVYKDTAFYLFDELKKRGYQRIAVISGDTSKTDDSDHETRKFEPILERFAPYTKLFNEKEWDFRPSSENLSGAEKYQEWLEWLQENNPKTLKKIQQPIDILIATDVLSEGQNLQDCDMVINYDIHWNPVRVIQRMGRVDRLGSPNKEIFGINFWPSDNINAYLNLKGRIEERMAMMKLAGSEVNLEFSDSFKDMASDADFEDKMNEKMLRQMETSWEDIEEHEAGLGFDNLSLEDFRQDLFHELEADREKYKNMPKGVYTGFKREPEICPREGIIALLGYPARPPQELNHQYQACDLIYIDKYGSPVLLNQKEVLEALARHKEKDRFVPDTVDRGSESAISGLTVSIKKWLDSQCAEEETDGHGTIKKRAGAETRDLLEKLKTGDRSAVDRARENLPASEKYRMNNVDLITWFLLS